ncbi:MAG TPA: hypothetical protein VFV28_02020, partial [Limnobacter sp.]|nr:hypothetical protein [Limnobacter sp.]
MNLSQVFTVAWVLGSALLAGCSSDDSPAVFSNRSAANPSGSTVLGRAALEQAMGGSVPLGLGCGWVAASDTDKANIAFPDSEAKYWVAAAPVSPRTRLRIDGRYPDARYFSYNAYDVALRPTDAVADFELTP